MFGLKASWGDVGTRPQDIVADFTHTGQESPCWAGGPGKAALLAAHLPGRLKSYFPFFHTYIEGGQLLAGVMLLE